MKLNKVKIPKDLLKTMDVLDRLYREHRLQAELMREEMIRTEAIILEKEDKELYERFAKGFIRLEVDWDTQEIVAVPTEDPQKKAQEVAEALSKNHENSN